MNTPAQEPQGNTAELVRSLEGWRGNARLYRVSPPMKYGYDYGDGDDRRGETEYVIVSAVVAMFSGPETYIFPAREDGSAIDMLELDGSYRGGLDHEAALRRAGYDA